MSKDALRIPEYLGHILQAIQRIGSYTDQNDLPELQQQILKLQTLC